MIRSRSKQPAPVQAAPDEPAAEVTKTQSVPAGFAAMAEQHHHQAGLASDRAARWRGDAQALTDAAERDAAQIIAAARSKALAITAEATAAEGEAAALVARAQQETAAGQLEDQAASADQRVSDLGTERDHLAGRVAGLDTDLAQVEAEQQDLGGHLAEARDTGDLDALTAAMGRIDAAKFLAADLKTRRAAAQERLDTIGDETGTGALATAQQAASDAHKAVRLALNALDPARPEAVQDRVLDELRGALAGNLERIAAEASPAQPHHVVVR